MLKAVSKMLADSKEEKVICARVIIEEVIDSLKDDPVNVVPCDNEDDLDPEANKAKKELQ